MDIKDRITKILREKAVPLILVLAVTMAAQALTNVRMAMGSILTEDLNSPTLLNGAQDLANNITGSGINIIADSATYLGENQAAGTFVDGLAVTGSDGSTPVFEIDSGVVLSSGLISDIGPVNSSDKKQHSFPGKVGDVDLEQVFGLAANDSAVLEFQFTADGDEVECTFVFAAEEYNEKVFQSKGNNEFLILIDGEPISLIPGKPPWNEEQIKDNLVRIYTVHGGQNNCNDKKDNDRDGKKNDEDEDCQFLCDNRVGEGAKNWEWFINNDRNDPDGCENFPYAIEADGFTKAIKLTATLALTTDDVHTVKFVIGQSRNSNFESWLFIEEGSFRTPCSESDVDTQGNPDPDGWGDPGTDFSGCAHNEHADNCPSVWNEEQLDNDLDGLGDECDDDDDNDGVLDVDDNCQFTVNPDQFDNDFDGFGDICDPDDDNDGILDDGDVSGVIGDKPCTGGIKVDCDDNCQFQANPSQADSEDFPDGVGDRCDNCVEVYNPSQLDTDGDGKGDATSEGPGCDESTVGAEEQADTTAGAPAGVVLDSDFDGVSDGQEVIDGTDPEIADTDGDGVSDGHLVPEDSGLIAGPDNCNDPALSSDQTDTDGDGQGDVCDPDDDNDLIADGPDDPDGAGPIKAGPDNCPLVGNFDQANIDLLDELAAGDPILGDVCDPDADGDGFVSVAFGGLDCDDLDASIPGPIEIPGNGKDDDCNPLTPDISISVE